MFFSLFLTHNSIIQEWSTIQLKNAWSISELGFDISLAILYGLLSVVCTVTLLRNLWFIMIGTKKSVPEDNLALVFLFILTVRK
jgi:hypothetical protein